MDESRIHIVEPDKSLQKRLSAGLKQNGFKVTAFDSGYPIVAMLDHWPDLFIIDIELPGFNGIELCKWLKTHESTMYIPVIFLSGDPYLKILAASAHANDYIEKPVTLPRMLRKVRSCLLEKHVSKA